MIILGIDPGIAIVGYCVLEIIDNSDYKILSWGSIQTNKNLSTSQRLLEIHNDLSCILTEFKPHEVAIEDLFFFKNAKTLVPVLQARGAILLTVEMHNIPSFTYTPLVVKKVITGYGRATKDEVKQMLISVLNIINKKLLDDVVDAAAIAYCHGRHKC